MFAAACTIAKQFTRPVVISRIAVDGKCTSSIGAFVVLNDDGWIMTAWHIVDMFHKLEASKASLANYEGELKKIESNQGLNSGQRKAALRQLGKPGGDVTKDWSVWWSWDAIQLTDLQGLPACDLAVGRLQDFDPKWISTYPTLKDPTKGFPIGTSLCKLGFPFHNIEPVYVNGHFELPADAASPPFFPMEGIATRNLLVAKHPKGFPVAFLETSSPGLRGQSGGPIFDQHGTIWALQSQTAHLPLGFNPPVPGGKRGEVEHQFLNVGMGVHPETLFHALKDLGIRHHLSTY